MRGTEIHNIKIKKFYLQKKCTLEKCLQHFNHQKG